MDLPQVVSREEWLTARKELLAKEKELSRVRDAINEERRGLPMVKVDKDYVFEGPEGSSGLLDLFDGRRQLIVYHFMWLWDTNEGCSSCSMLTDNIGHLSHLHAADTSLALVSRAPFADIQRFRARMGWTVPWYSSYRSNFNYDFNATMDESVAPVEYNYKDKATLTLEGLSFFIKGDGHGVSVFLRDGDEVFHTYSTYGRGADLMVGTFNYLDLTALGRQRHISQFLHHDRYDT
ncbi:DUF899 domain-containing protein [Streptosporangium sp. KLBMP 9127]|nr:DUF899 domain-containing protein [Streptosporangium sp. KLBMP 9127]